VMNPRLGRSVGMTMLARLALLAVLVVAAACGEDAPAEPAGLTAAIKYEVIGGDAFRDDKVTIQPDGRASIQTRAGIRTATLSAAERAALSREIEAAGLRDLDSAVTEPPIPDALSYRFTYRGHEVETDTGKLPEELRGLIATFNDLIERYGA
jgi:hypothetical protein